MISCRAVAKIVASDALAAASRWSRFEIWLHLAICRHCQRFAQQLAGIRKVVRGFMAESASEPVPADLEERVLERVRRA